MNCPHCHSEFEPQPGQQFCPSCGHPLGEPQNESASTGSHSESFEPVPFENRDKYDLINGFYQTFRESLFNPTNFFRQMPPKGDGFMPILYAIIWVVGITIINYFITSLFGLQNQGMEILRNIMGSRYPIDESFLHRSMVSQILMLPFIQIIYLIILAGIIHLFALMFQAGSNGFIGTLRVVGYTQGVNIFSLIPIVGGLITFVYEVVLLIIGIREVHRTTTGKAAASVLLPLVLCCVCILFGIISVAASIVGAAGALD